MADKKILDYGCGLGGNFRYLSKRGDYRGVDILPENIEYAKKRYGDKYFTQITDGLPFENESFDEIHLYDVLEHVSDLPATLREISRVLKKGGRIFITVPAKISEEALLKIRPDYFKEVGHVRIVEPEKLAKDLEEKGFKLDTQKKVRGMEAVMLGWLFRKNAGQRMVAHQTGSPQFSKFLVAFIWIFDTRLFRTPLKYLFFIYVFTLPIGWLISRVFPKSIYLEFIKHN